MRDKNMNKFILRGISSPLIVVLGPTASGKTSLGVKLSKALNGEIISADSRQVYQGMDIGTGKDLDEYGSVPYHLIDIVKPGQDYNVFSFARDFAKAFLDINSRGKVPFLVGGTGMYLDAVIRRYQMVEAPENKKLRTQLEEKSHSTLVEDLLRLKPEQHNETDIHDKARTIRALEIALAEQNPANTIAWPDYQTIILGLQFPREQTRARITERLKSRLSNGMIEEVETLKKSGVSDELLNFYGLEYRFVSQYLRGELSHNDMYQKLNSAIHQFAKQQEKWFRNIEKKGGHIHWLDTAGDYVQEALETTKTCLQQELR
jgi:tRNA dimethylallyltransferase